MLQWEKQLYSEAGGSNVAKDLDAALLLEVLVIRWPDGEIMRMPAGSTAADAAWRMGMDGKIIFLNNQAAPPYVQLQDGDVVEVRM
jgi:(p)ppGpp synthase/HD superfamily hydrolase